MESWYGLTIPMWCVFVAAALAFLPRFVVPIMFAREGKRYDNHHPRLQQATLTGLAARGQAAHQNSMEGFPLFAVAALIAERHVLDKASDPDLVSALCAAYVLIRVVYIAFYLGDIATARSLTWGVGIGVCIALFFV